MYINVFTYFKKYGILIMKIRNVSNGGNLKMIFNEDDMNVRDYKRTMVEDIINAYSEDTLYKAINEWLKSNDKYDEGYHIYKTSDLLNKLFSNKFDGVTINGTNFSLSDLKSYETLDFTSKYFYIDTIVTNKVLISMNSLDEFKKAYIDDILESMSLGELIENYVLNY